MIDNPLLLMISLFLVAVGILLLNDKLKKKTKAHKKKWNKNISLGNKKFSWGIVLATIVFLITSYTFPKTTSILIRLWFIVFGILIFRIIAEITWLIIKYIRLGHKIRFTRRDKDGNMLFKCPICSTTIKIERYASNTDEAGSGTCEKCGETVTLIEQSIPPKKTLTQNNRHSDL